MAEKFIQKNSLKNKFYCTLLYCIKTNLLFISHAIIKFYLNISFKTYQYENSMSEIFIFAIKRNKL